MANVCSFRVNPNQFKAELLKNIKEFSLNKDLLKDSKGNIIPSEDNNNLLRQYVVKCIIYSLKNRTVDDSEKQEAINNIKIVFNSFLLKKYNLNKLITDDTINEAFNAAKSISDHLSNDYILTNYTTDKLEKDNKTKEYKESFTTRYLSKYFHNNAQLKAQCKEWGSIFITKYGIFNNTGDSAFIIGTDEELNRYLRQGQENLYKTVKRFYDTDNKLPESLYTIEGRYTGAWEQFNFLYGDKVNSDIYSTDKLNSLYVNSKSFSKSKSISAKQELNAYMCYVMLQEFDTILRNNLSTIHIEKSLPKFYSNTDNNTYRYSLTKSKAININKTWRTNEDIFTDKEISNLIKLLVQNIDINDINGARKLQFKEFSYIIGKIKNLIYDLQGNGIDLPIGEYSQAFQNNSLQELIASIRENPKKYLTEVFKLLSNDEFYENYSDGGLKKMLDNYDRIIIKALYNNLFDFTNSKSLAYANKTLGYNKGMNYFDYICQSCDGIVSAKYVQYYKDENGACRLRNLYDQTVVGVRRDIDESILINNSKRFGLKKYNNNGNYLSYAITKGNLTKVTDESEAIKDLKKVAYTFSYDSNTYTLIKDKDTGKSILCRKEGNNLVDITSNKISDQNLLNEVSNVAKYLSDFVLGTNFNLNDKYWQIYKTVSNSENNADINLLDLIGEIIYNQVLSNKVIEPEFQKSINTSYNDIVKPYNRNGNLRVNNKLQEIYLIGKNQTAKVEGLAKAKAIITGKLNSSQLKDGSGNALPTETLSRLLSNVWTQVTLQNNKEDSATKDFSLFKTGVFRGIYQAKEFKDAKAASSKSHTEFTAKEMESAEIFYDFLKGLQDSDKTSISDVVGNGNVAFLPSDNSDKSNIGRIIVNINKTFEQDLKNLGIYTPMNRLISEGKYEDALRVISTKLQKDIGGFYKNVLINQQKLWNKFNSASQEYFKYHFDINGFVPVGIELYEGILLHAQDFSKINEAYLQGLKEVINTNGSSLTPISPIEFINEVTRWYNNTHTDNITITDEQLFNINKENGTLLPNINIIGNLMRFSSEESVDNYFKEQAKIVIKDLINDGFDGINFPKELKNNICTITIQAKDPSNNHKVITETYNIVSREDFANKVSEIGSLLGRSFRPTDDLGVVLQIILNNKNVSVQINPILDIYNRLNYLYTQEWMLSTVGGHFNHPNKIKWKDNQSTVIKKLRLNYLENPQNAKYPTSIDKYVPWNRLLRLFNYDISSLSKFIQSLDNYGTVRIDKSGIFTTDFTKFIETELSKYNLNDINSIIEELSNIGLPKSYTSIFNNYLHGYTPSNGNHVLGLYEIIDLDEAGRFNSQNKRNVSFTAAMHPFMLNSLDGITTDSNICVIRDNIARIATVTGVDTGVPTSDGATYVNPFQAIWENGSLGSEKVGLNKKQFIHFYNEQMGSGGIIKTAGFSLNNERMRDSIGYRRMMKLMTDRKWRDQDGNLITQNILTNYRGEPIQFTNPDSIDNTVYIKKYDKNGNSYFSRFIGIKYLGKNQNGNIEYEVTTQQIDPETRINIKENVDKDIYTIESNYDLWNALGGYNCYELKPGDDKLTTSEFSIKKVAEIANQVGIIKGGINPDDITSQKDLYQFMKHSDIHYMPTEGAVKQGAANVEDINDYLKGKQVGDFKPNFYKIHMYQAGIQLDKEHNADQEDLSIFTQVLSACASRGYTLQQAKGLYVALASLAKYATKGYMKPLEQYIKASSSTDSSKRRFQQKVANLIATALMTQSNSTGVIEQVATRLMDLAEEGKEAQFVDNIPYSDPSIYKKIQSIISVALTSSAIKIKMPGLLAVLCPSYNIYKLYGNRLLSKWNDGELDTLQKEADDNPIWFYGNWDKNNDGEQTGDIELSKTYKIYYNDSQVLDVLQNIKLNYTTEEPQKQNGNTTINTQENGYVNVLIETPAQRKALVDLLNLQPIVIDKVCENISVGRDLAPYNVYFKAKNLNTGEVRRFSLYDCDTVMRRFDIQDKSNPSYVTDDELQLVLNILNPEDKNTIGSNLTINNQQWEVDKSSIDIHPYELIMPKVFATNFGLSYDSDLYKIEHDGQYFTNRIIKQNQNLIDSNYYNLAFTNMSGEPLYVLDRNQLTDSNGNLLPNLYKDTSVVTTVDEYGRVSIINDDYQSDITLSKNQNDLNNNENLKQDEVYNYIDSAGKIHRIIVTDSLNYYINNFDANTVNISKQKYQNNQDTLRELIQQLSNSDNKSVSEYFKALFTDYQEQLITDNVSTFNSRYGKLFNAKNNTNNSKNLSQYIFSVQDQLQKAQSISDLKDIPQEYINYISEQGSNIYNSFIQSLNLIAARIPAQSMQSFMPMRIAAFIDSDVNTAYVSTLQTYLQGSDYDIDAVSLSMYAFDRHGKFIGWAEPFDTSSKELFKASMKLPFPSSETFSNSDFAYSEKGYDVSKLNDIIDENGNLTIDKDANKLQVFADFMTHVNTYGLIFGEDLKGNDEEGNKLARREAILKAVNRYNNYLSRIHDTKKLENMHKNYIEHSIFSIINNPVNQIEAEYSVDYITKPYKDLANSSSMSKDFIKNGPGAFTTNIHAIINNQVGKKCIGIAAVGLKTFFATTQYFNNAIHSGEEIPLHNVEFELWKNDHRNLVKKTYNIIANANPYNSTIKSINDQDFALCLSALLSLATDNAKELALAKLNCGENTMGMWLFGTFLGMTPKEIFDIMTSPIARVIARQSTGNVFTGESGNSVDFAISYLENGPKIYSENLKQIWGKPKDQYSGYEDLLKDHDIITFLQSVPLDLLYRAFVGGATTDSSSFEDGIDYHNIVNILLNTPFLHDSAFNKLSEKIKDNIIRLREQDKTRNNPYFSEGKGCLLDLDSDIIKDILELVGRYRFAKQKGNNKIIPDTKHGIYTLDLLKQRDGSYNDDSNYFKKLIYWKNMSAVARFDLPTFKSFKTLQKGAKELQTLGRLLHLNQGLYTSDEETFNLLNTVQTLLKDHIINLHKFLNEKDYQQKILHMLDKQVVFVNPLRVMLSNEHYREYLSMLNLQFNMGYANSLRYRMTYELGNKVCAKAGAMDSQSKKSIFKKIGNYADSYIINDFLQNNDQDNDFKPKNTNGFRITIPKGTEYYIKNQNSDTYFGDTPKYQLTTADSDTEIILGTAEGNASFKHFMENEVIPNLKQGRLQHNGSENFFIKNNKFIQSLSRSIYTRTLLGNPINTYTLGINGTPRTDIEITLLEDIKNSFNQLKTFNGKYTVGEHQYSIPELFYLYNLITYKNKTNEKSLTRVFDDSRDFGFIPQYEQYITKLDLNTDYIGYENLLNQNEFLAQVLPYNSEYTSKLEKFINIDNITGNINLYTKVSKPQYSSEIDLEENEFEGDENPDYMGQIDEDDYPRKKFNSNYIHKQILPSNSDFVSYDIQDTSIDLGITKDQPNSSYIGEDDGNEHKISNCKIIHNQGNVKQIILTIDNKPVEIKVTKEINKLPIIMEYTKNGLQKTYNVNRILDDIITLLSKVC